MIHPINMPADFMAENSRESVYGRSEGGEPLFPHYPNREGNRNAEPATPATPGRMWNNVFAGAFISRMRESERESEEANVVVSEKFDETDAELPIHAIRFPKPLESVYSSGSLELKWIDLKIQENAIAHHTDEFDITERPRGAHLVVRRGQAFELDVSFYRDFDTPNDKLRLVFETGQMPSESKGTRIGLQCKSGARSSGWLMESCQIVGGKVQCRVKPSPSALIGCYQMKVVSNTVDREGVKVENECPVQAIYLLFNPWAEDDQVFMPSTEDRDEYVMNDVGKIWRGSHNAVKPTFWSFGQFEEGILEACMSVLDRSSLRHPQRSSPIHVCRTVSQMIACGVPEVVNSSDDRGILVGNWTNSYRGGTPPTQWTGSGPILKQYYEYGRSVRYGQCWVFAGVVTTILRCFGIPSRVVTNFSSAHDTDTTCTVDVHFAEDTGKLFKEYNADSVWNFHVWNDCWMARPDLPGGHDGWQAIDGTPQEKSDGLYRAGPASLKAIKRGQVSLGFDTGFIFAEVNADKCYWLVNERREAQLNEIKKNEIGRMIWTKRPGRHLERMQDDLLDITDEYKYPEMTDAERLAVMNALLMGHSDVFEAYQDQIDSSKDTVFELDLKERPLIGQDIHPCLKITNRSSEIRTVKASMRVAASMYTGAQGQKIKGCVETIEITPGETKRLCLVVNVMEYLYKLLDQAVFLVTIMCHVKETNQIFACTDDCRVIMPDISIDVLEQPIIQKPCKVQLRLSNPLPVMLTNCKFLLEGPGLLLTKEYPCSNIPSRGVAEVTVTLTPWKLGERTLVAHFEADQLHDVDGSCAVVVRGQYFMSA